MVNNTPNTVRFRQKIHFSQNHDSISNKLQTPKELGLEQTTKIISCIPNSGTIEPYS